MGPACDARIRGSPRRWAWLAPTLVTLLAGILRVWNLGHPHAFIFDETYYVKDAWTQWVLGYAATWPDGANESFLAGDTDVFTSTGSFVVHPPLGKLLIGAGMALFGPDSVVRLAHRRPHSSAPRRCSCCIPSRGR